MALRLTNEFRASQGHGPLEWSQELHDIAKTHNVDMGEGVYGFGHEGYEDRAD